MPRWEPVRASADSVHVWRADLAAIANVDGDDGWVEDLLSADERARAARIVDRHRRVLWARSRGMLRALLGRYLDRDPCTLEFVFGPHGKPALLGAGPARAAAELRFNLSHAGGLALVAVSSGREVGVDIERPRERYTAEFLRAWVAREATVKCRGTGLIAPPPLPPQGSQEDGLWTAELDLGPDATAAVAIAGGRCELRCREWRAARAPRRRP
jgi:4'-phosphopantetheinyl transferase